MVAILLKNELRYGTRYLFRDNFLCRARIRTLLTHERIPAEELRPLTDQLLLRSLRRAARCLPFYRSIKTDFDVSSVREALAERFPIIDRDDLLSRRSALYPFGGKPYPWTIIGRTSGTSGTPLDVFRSAKSVVWENAFIGRHLYWSGYRVGMRRAYLRGDLVVPVDRRKPPFWFFNRYNNQLVVSSRHLRDEHADVIIEALTKFAPFLMQAYPSTAYELASILERRDGYLSIPYVYTSSEPLYPHQRELIEQRLQTRVMDHYGMAERVAFASECEYGGLHLNTDYSYVELVDDHGRPTREEGYVVGTTLHNDLMPLVRYRLSDRTRWRSVACPCGRAYPAIEPVSGKFEDVLYGADGQKISPSVVTFAFKGLRHVKRSQVAQVAREEWQVRVVPLNGFGVHERNQLIGNVRQLVDPRLKVTIVEVSDIPQTAAGKYKWIVNEYRAEEKVNAK